MQKPLKMISSSYAFISLFEDKLNRSEKVKRIIFVTSGISKRNPEIKF